MLHRIAVRVTLSVGLAAGTMRAAAQTAPSPPPVTTLRNALPVAAWEKRNRALTPAFAAIDGGVGYRLDRWEIHVDGRNLGDRRDAVSESELGDAQYHLLPARRVDATAAVWF
jgi:outer membrane receptor protein involved in Fe transport